MTEEYREHHPWFDGLEVPASTDMDFIAGTAYASIEYLEKTQGRKRAPRATVTARRTQQVRALIAAAAHCHLTKVEKDNVGLRLVKSERTEEDGWLAIIQGESKLNKLGQTRYANEVMHKTLPDTLKKLSETNWLEYRPGTYGGGFGTSTTYRAGEKLIELLKMKKVFSCEIKRSHDEELVILKGQKTRSNTPTDWLDYEETRTTTEYREDLHEINDWYQQNDIELDLKGHPMDTSRVRMRRYFNNGSLDKGGRMFGGWWQYLNKDYRQHIRINGESVSDLDYNAMSVRLLYCLSGAPFPESDPYIPKGHSLEAYRNGTKEFLVACLNMEKRPSRLPAGTRAKLPAKTSYQFLLEQFEAMHEPVWKYFFPGESADPIAFRLMHMESTLMSFILLELKDRDIVGLNMHDGLMVPLSRADEAADVMKTAFADFYGRDAVVTRENY